MICLSRCLSPFFAAKAAKREDGRGGYSGGPGAGATSSGGGAAGRST